MATIDEYLKSIKPAQRVELERIRKIIKLTVPEAEETISYGMPTFKYKSKRLIYFAAYQKRMSLFGSLGPMEEKLGDFKLSHKGTLQFTEDNPIPDATIIEIALMRLAEISKG
jgi:uncharacterized protein YdhG (YjbR/CyaY superfamily)